MNVLNILNEPWAIMPEKLISIQEIYLAHSRGERADIAAIEARIGKPLKNKAIGYQNIDGVAVLPIDGVIAKRMNMFAEISGGVSSELLQGDFMAALRDPNVNAVLLLVDSPGGQVDGTQQTADLIRNARGQKPIYALADGTMASAAYWIGSAADKVFVVSDTTAVGSIGIVASHTDYSKAQEKAGVKVTNIVAGKYKAIASENAPLSEEGRATIQDQVDHAYGVFVDSVARNRNVSSQIVLKNMADGRVFFGKKAIQAGLVDGMATFSDLITTLSQRAEPLQAVTTSLGLAAQITKYVEDQKKLGKDVSCSQALAAIEATGNVRFESKTKVEPIQSEAAEKKPLENAPMQLASVVSMASRISDYVRTQAALGNHVTYADAAAHVEMQDKDPNNPGAIADRISAYVNEEAKHGRHVSFAQAAADLERKEARG